MHPNPRRIIPALVLLIVLAAVGTWYYFLRPAQNGNGALAASGTLEITQVQVSPELGGKALSVQAAEGQQVQAGDPLVQLDTALLQAQRLQAAASLEAAQANGEAARFNVEAAQAASEAAQANLEAAGFSVQALQANLDLLQAGASAEQLAAAQAQLAQAQSNQQAAEASLAALTAGARPEDVSAARLRLDLARQAYYEMTVVISDEQQEEMLAALTTAQSNLTQAQARQAGLDKDERTPPSGREAAATALSEAQIALQAVRQAYDELQAEVPFYQQIELARQAWELAQLNQSQAEARRQALQGEQNMLDEALEAAENTVDDAQALVDDSQAAHRALNDSDQGRRLSTAWTEAEAALSDLNRLGRTASTPLEAALSQAEAAAATSALAGANLGQVQGGARDEQVRAAQAQLDMARAQVSLAQANLTAAQARQQAAEAQADAALAQVYMAQAALEMLDVQIGKLTILAPTDGVVLTRLIEPGEFAAPGAALLVLGRTADKTITVYISEDRYGQVSLGQAAEVSVDSFPGVTFRAVVTSIAGQAEFTPRNVQTADGRKTTVFAIRLQVEDPGDSLKAGMPADVVFK